MCGKVSVSKIENEIGINDFYNLAISNTHTFYVSNQGILVHNANKDCETVLYRGSHKQDIEGGLPVQTRGRHYTTNPVVAAGYAATYGAGLYVVTMPSKAFNRLLGRGAIEIDFNEKDSYKVNNLTAFNKAVKRRKYGLCFRFGDGVFQLMMPGSLWRRCHHI